MEHSPESDVFMSAESLSSVAIMGSPAVGTIDPETRVIKGEIDNETIDKVFNDIVKHYDVVDDELSEKAIPAACVDGRTDVDGAPLAANSAGATYSLVIGTALIDAPSLIAHNETSASHGKKIFIDLKDKGFKIGAHTDENAPEGKCGCGACERQAEILTFIAEHIDELSEKAAGLGIDIADELKAKIATNSSNLVDANYVSNGAEMVEVVKEVAGEKSVQTLQGSHNEVVLAINVNKPGQTLNRRSLEAEFGKDYQAFNLDVWALNNGIKEVSASETEAAEKFAAAVLYNIATACVLAGPSLRVKVV